MNFSHGSYDYHQSVIDNTRKAVSGKLCSSPHQIFPIKYVPQANSEARSIAIALDTASLSLIILNKLSPLKSIQKGPEIRTGLMRNGQDVGSLELSSPTQVFL